MDTEQIQQQMRARRAAIDLRLDALSARGRAAQRRMAPIAIGIVAALIGAIAVRASRRRRREQPRTRLRSVA